MKNDQSAQQVAVRKARRMLEEAEERLKVTKRWVRDFDSIVEPAGRQLDGLRERLAQQFPKAVVAMDRTIGALQDYAEVKVVPREKRAADEKEEES